ncbi:hypothetical protein KR018_012413 [Drosophila ironensis]|nr:hypothetical protein KR018_012413 [Drosophila ironensis]
MCNRANPDYSGNTYLAIKLGSQVMRAMIMDAQMNVTFTTAINYDVDLPEFNTQTGILADAAPNEALVNPVMWVKALDMLISSLASQGADLHSIVSIGGSSPNTGTIYWSETGLRRLCNLNAGLRLHEQLTDAAFEVIRTPTWRDTSTDPQAQELEEAIGGPAESATITGSRVYGWQAGPQIRKIYQTCPEHYKRTPRISMASSLLSSLLIGTIAPIEYTDGSCMNLLDIHTKQWSQKCLDACAPDLARRLMKPIDPTRLLGRVADYYVRRWNFRPDCMVVPVIGIKSAELAGLPGKEGILVISLDDKDAVLMPFKKAPILYEGNVLVHATRTERFMAKLSFRNGSLARNIICQNVALGNWDRFNEMLDDTPMGNDGNLAVHFIDREIIPIAKGTLRWNAETDPMTRESLSGCEDFPPEVEARAVIEGQIMHHCTIVRELGFNPVWGIKIIAVGPDASNQRLLQIVANVFGSPVYVRKGPDVALLGSIFRARYAFYRYREWACNCTECRKGNKGQLLSYEELFRDVPDGLELAVEPVEGAEKIYEPLMGRLAQMCQLMAAGYHKPVGIDSAR